MSAPGDLLLDGKVVVVSVDTNGLILSIEFPGTNIDGTGTPLTITYNVGQSVAVTENTAQAIVDALGL